MRPLFGICFCLAMILPAAVYSAERRCGWYSSPTPGNLILTDGDGEWWIQTQGRPDPKGIDNLPAFDDRQFVETNVPGAGYGYGCACMTVVTSARQQRITRVIAGDILPLARCRNDGSLPDPD
ncbi:DUF4087 domain-containing protein [Phyllobacterium zundukense]|uniref:DUF4087 domain-containing protein n=1 Tax=Phyllobacterium zundukense TaxID=1867719 RepID=A0ACD4CY41_9HYPH|nr:DUF4087 domain-containing protein [Phyllobacterium zundukense]UXN58500.1 DUF4087 domain-containing protein [Phyllobacterium zundukense]